jgi:hypothetical protein
MIIGRCQTDSGDPDAAGRFGIHGCMGRVRGWSFGAVIGVGGIGPEPTQYGIDGRVTRIGIGPHRARAKDPRGPLVTFEHFVLFDERGPLLHEHAPRLAKRMYEGRVRVLLHPTAEEAREIARLLRLALNPPPSSADTASLTRRAKQRRCGKKHSPHFPNRCAPESCSTSLVPRSTCI